MKKRLKPTGRGAERAFQQFQNSDPPPPRKVKKKKYPESRKSKDEKKNIKIEKLKLKDKSSTSFPRLPTKMKSDMKETLLYVLFPRQK